MNYYNFYDTEKGKYMLTTGIINACIEEAKKSDYRFKLGAVCFKGTRIISRSHNYLRSCSAISTKYRKWDNSLHAEMSAILRAGDWSKLKGASILVMKVSKTYGLISNAKPCSHCLATIKFVGIKNIYYSNNEGEIVKYIDED